MTSRRSPSATRVALALMAGARGEPLSTPALIGAAELLGVSANSLRIALSRLTARGDLVSAQRGIYELSADRRAAIEHVRRYRSGFAKRITWTGACCAVVTTHLDRRNGSLAKRRERALAWTGFRALWPGVYVRPDNLEGGRLVLAAELGQLGLDPEADVVGLSLDPQKLVALTELYAVERDAAQAGALTQRIETLLARMPRMQARSLAAQTFWLGDEALRFLARDPLLPATMADEAPRRELARAMTRLDQSAYAAWRTLLARFEDTSRAAR